MPREYSSSVWRGTGKVHAGCRPCPEASVRAGQCSAVGVATTCASQARAWASAGSLGGSLPACSPVCGWSMGSGSGREAVAEGVALRGGRDQERPLLSNFPVRAGIASLGWEALFAHVAVASRETQLPRVLQPRCPSGPSDRRSVVCACPFGRGRPLIRLCHGYVKSES